MLSVLLAITMNSSEPPPTSVVPSERQIAWHQLEYYALVHSGLNEMYDKEWAYGDESLADYNPEKFDANHVCKVLKKAGMKGVVWVAKHHGGFCLWPSKYTDYSVKSTKWRGGKGDMIAEMSKACKKAGLKFGVYLSPWDRNHADYGRPAYVQYYRDQLRELMTNYGELFEVWFDGANGGDGFYGGARETRTIDRASYYGWNDTWEIVRQLQPGAVMFSDVGPDVRWVGNEAGIADDTHWHTMTPIGDSVASRPGPGDMKYEFSPSGSADGKLWLPAECDTPLRPGWFWHANQEGKARTAEQIRDVYFKSVGRGASLNFGLVIRPDGTFPDDDAEKLGLFGDYLANTFKVNLARTGKVTAASSVWPGSNMGHLLDGNADRAWCSAEGDRAPWIEIDLKKEVTFDVLCLQEKVGIGQRVMNWKAETWIDGQWRPFHTGTTIGYKRLVRLPNSAATKLRLTFTTGGIPVAISELGLYREAGPTNSK